MATLDSLNTPSQPGSARVYDDIMPRQNGLDNISGRRWRMTGDLRALAKHQGNHGAGRLDALTKEMVLRRVRLPNQCPIARFHTVARERRYDDGCSELIAVVGMANETNRLASAYQVEIDEDLSSARQSSLVSHVLI